MARSTNSVNFILYVPYVPLCTYLQWRLILFVKGFRCTFCISFDDFWRLFFSGRYHCDLPRSPLHRAKNWDGLKVADGFGRTATAQGRWPHRSPATNARHCGTAHIAQQARSNFAVYSKNSEFSFKEGVRGRRRRPERRDCARRVRRQRLTGFQTPITVITNTKNFFRYI